MATVVKTFVFASDAEGLADSGSSSVMFGYVSVDGNPAGSVEFGPKTFGAGSGTGYGRKSGTADTWETWGIPAGATVTNVQITAWDAKIIGGVSGESAVIKTRIIDSGGASVHSAGDLLNQSFGNTPGNWLAQAAGASRAVDAAKQASTTPVRLELQGDLTFNPPPSSETIGLDNIQLTITYSGGGSGTTLNVSATAQMVAQLSPVKWLHFLPSVSLQTVLALQPQITQYPPPTPLSATVAGVMLLQPNPAVPVGVSATAQMVGKLSGPVVVTSVLPSKAEWEVRIYDSQGRRKYVPQNWISTLEFEILERGGYGTGTIQFSATWEELQLAGNERVDVWLLGALAYRGIIRVAQNEVAAPERASPTMHGLIETLGAYMVTKRYAYGCAADLAAVFSDLVNDHVRIAGRLPAVALDAQTIGVSLQTFDAVGGSVAQALNKLCDLAPSQCIWGADVDAALSNRLYLRPRSSTVAHVYSLGNNVEAFVYPRDTGAVENRLLITGGKVKQANLLKNGSFEQPAPNSETVNNLLRDYSFEQQTPWNLVGGATIQPSGHAYVEFLAARTGSWLLEIDTPGEAAYQDVIVDYRTPLRGSVYAHAEAVSITADLKMQVIGLDATGATVVTTQLGPFALPANLFWKQYTLDVDFSAYPSVRKARFRVETTLGFAANSGTLVEDVGLWERCGAGQQSWSWSLAGAATRVALDWAHKGIAAYHGGYCVRAQAGGIGLVSSTSPDYLEISATLDSRVAVGGAETYTVGLFWQGIGYFTYGVRQYASDGSLIKTSETGLNGGNVSAWTPVNFDVKAELTATAFEFFLRMRDNTPLYFDTCLMMKYEMPAEIASVLNPGGYWSGDIYERTIDTSNAALTGLSSAAAASIATYGVREARVSSENVVDYDTMLAFATGYLNAHAIPKVQARMRLYGITEVLKQDGAVKLVGLPTNVPALFPSRIRYQIGEAITCEADLGNERPDLALLLRLTEQRRLAGIL